MVRQERFVLSCGRTRTVLESPFPTEPEGPYAMEAAELQAKAAIAAALIVSNAVEVPRIHDAHQGPPDEAAMRLRLLTEYVYRAITTAD